MNNRGRKVYGKQSRIVRNQMYQSRNGHERIPNSVNVIKCNQCQGCYEKQLKRRTYTMKDVPRSDYVTNSCRDHLNWRPIEKLNLISPCLNYVKIGLGPVKTTICADTGDQ